MIIEIGYNTHIKKRNFIFNTGRSFRELTKKREREKVRENEREKKQRRREKTNPSVIGRSSTALINDDP